MIPPQTQREIVERFKTLKTSHHSSKSALIIVCREFAQKKKDGSTKKISPKSVYLYIKKWDHGVVNYPGRGAQHRFWRQVKKGPGCWEWQGSKGNNGYGLFYLNGKLVGAHRYSLEISIGRKIGDLLACHTCDNRLCVRPAHLVAASPLWNMHDAISKGRARNRDGTVKVLKRLHRN